MRQPLGPYKALRTISAAFNAQVAVVKRLIASVKVLFATACLYAATVPYLSKIILAFLIIFKADIAPVKIGTIIVNDISVVITLSIIDASLSVQILTTDFKLL